MLGGNEKKAPSRSSARRGTDGKPATCREMRHSPSSGRRKENQQVSPPTAFFPHTCVNKKEERIPLRHLSGALLRTHACEMDNMLRDAHIHTSTRARTHEHTHT